MKLSGAVPVLRMFDEDAARKFYLDQLGFTAVFEHRFEPGLPLYMRIRRDALILDLSEHVGDGIPGSVVWIPVTDVEALHQELTTAIQPDAPPEIDTEAPGGPTLTLTDPFSNQVRFCQA